MFLISLAMMSLYALACFWLCWQWITLPKLPKNTPPMPVSSQTSENYNFFISVIIPVRNEAANIGQLLTDLKVQTFDNQQFEIIVVNDASTDETASIVQQYLNSGVILLNLEDIATTAPKKRAINEGIKIAKGTHIVTTDGDCRVQPEWLEIFAQTFIQTQAKFISGPVTFFDDGGLFCKSQIIEFSSLIGSGGALINAKMPSLCNGANLGYERSAFEAVGGFAGTEHVASGDDELLLQKIAKQFSNNIVFLKNQKAIVHTSAQPTFRSFYEQRIRWASKWAVNKRLTTMITAVFVFLVNTGLLVCWALFCANIFSEKELYVILLLKAIPEFCFLLLIISFLEQKKALIFIPFVQLFYPLYTLIFGIVAQRKGYSWKNRKLV